MPTYKIRNAAGRYSTGGDTPKWTKKGKSWGTLSALKAHINLVNSRWLSLVRDTMEMRHRDGGKHPYQEPGVVIETYEVVSEEPINLVDFYRGELAGINEAIATDLSLNRSPYRWTQQKREAIKDCLRRLGFPDDAS